MESHEEKLAIMIRQSKEREAQQELDRKAKQIARENRSKGISPGGIASMRDFADDLRSGAASATAALEQSTMPGIGAGIGSVPFPGSGGGGSYAPPPKKGTGMQLGAAKKGAMGGHSLLQAMAAEGDVVDPALIGGGGGGGAGAAMAAAAAAAGAAGGGAAQGPISLNAEEKLVVTMSRDGGLGGMEVKGDLHLLVSDP